MDEPTDNQLKILRDDIISGRVMIVEVEHYKTLTDNLSKSYDANKEQAERIKELEEKLDDEIQCRRCSAKTEMGCKSKKRIQELERPLKAAGFKVDGMLAVGNELSRQDRRIQEIEAALTRIDNWAKAYPLKVFPEPDFKEVAQVLKDAGISLDAVSASNMRHVITGIRDIVEQAL